MGYHHQVEMKLAANDAAGRLRRIESWCADWEIGFRVLDRFPGSERIRNAFESLRLARTFIGYFGGVIIDEREIQDALASDAADEGAYFAREFPD